MEVQSNNIASSPWTFEAVLLYDQKSAIMHKQDSSFAWIHNPHV